VLAKAGGLWSPEARSREHGWGEAQMHWRRAPGSRGRGRRKRTSLRHVWCRGRGRCAACGSPSPSLPCVWCRGRGRCAAWASQSQSLCHVWCHRCRRCPACGVAVAVLVPCGCRRRRLCVACGVAVAVFAPRAVSRVPLLPRMWCRRRSPCAAWVSLSRSLRRVWCCGCCRPAARGVCSHEEHGDVARAAAREAATGRTQLGGVR
jgi:hypothetical protein